VYVRIKVNSDKYQHMPQIREHAHMYPHSVEPALSSPIRTMPRVTYFSKVRIITLAQNGMSQRQISATLGIPKSTISATTHRHNLIDTC
jgi:hypothetical protein